MSEIISAKNVVKIYDTGSVKVKALKGINLSIEKGEMVAIMGPSGCGKTTLLNCLSGIDDINSGEILIEGKSIEKLDDDSKTIFRANRMGFVFQFYNLLPILSAVENVEVPLLLSGIDIDKARKIALEMLEKVGLAHRSSQRPSALSGGERQRVTIARALANSPAIIWADEPTGDLDKKTSDDIIELMIKLNRENKQTFVIVTHDPEVGEKCDRIIHMRDGIIADYSGNIDAIRKDIHKEKDYRNLQNETKNEENTKEETE